MIVVSNTTPLIGLASIGRFDMLKQLFSEICIAQAVYTEMGLQKIGTVGILLKAKQVGLLQAIRPELERLHQHGFSISRGIIDAVAQQAGE